MVRTFSVGIINPKLLYIEQSRESNTTTRAKAFDAKVVVSSTHDDFYSCIRPLLRFGRLTGIIPITGLWNASGRLIYKWNTSAAITSVILTTLLSINVIFSVFNLGRTFAGTGGGNAVDLALSAQRPLFYLSVILICIFFQAKAKNMVMIFSTWRKVSSDLTIRKSDTNLFRNITTFASIIYVSAVIETVLENLTEFGVMKESNIKSAEENSPQISALEVYFTRSHPFWAIYVTFHPVLAVLLLICNWISVHVWNLADILIIAFSRALYFKFKALLMETDKKLVPSMENRCHFKLDGITWGDVRRDHLILCKLLDEFETFLSPFIFLSYTINIFLICLKLHQGLTSGQDRTLLESLTSTWSFFHLIFRTMAISLTASKINEYAHQISVPIHKCSSIEYCKEVERLERMLGTGPLGLSGLGCFIITRSFILVVVSVIFTMEIVLLQASSTGGSRGTPVAPMTRGA